MDDFVKQTGLLTKPPEPSDYRTSAATIIERNASGDWRPYEPTAEKQYGLKFDTMSCTTFSALNTIETTVNWMVKNGKMPQYNLDGLKALGFFDEDGNFNASDRFTAIMSNTTPDGNYFQSVWDSIRKHDNGHGLLPEKDLPFGGKNWNQYHDKSLITDAMKAKAKEVWKYLSFTYSWVTFDDDPDFTTFQQELCKKALKQSPLHIAIPVPSKHAIMCTRIGENDLNTFDQYPPFQFVVQIQYPIHYAMLGFTDIVPEVKEAPRVLKLTTPSMKGDDVKKLQAGLITLGYLKDIADGIFGAKTKAAVIAFQKANGLVADGIYGAKSMAKLEEVLKKKSPSDQCIEIIKSFEGYSSVPYKDPIGVWTIGYGTTVIDGVKVSKNTPQITEARATMLLKAHVAGVASDLEKSTDCSKLTQHQFDALVSFVYNVGIGNFNKSSLRKNLPDKVTKRNFTDWNKADGKVLPGLVRRREEEYSLFTKPIV